MDLGEIRFQQKSRFADLFKVFFQRAKKYRDVYRYILPCDGLYLLCCEYMYIYLPVKDQDPTIGLSKGQIIIQI